ncbi:hypothetical protein [Acetobacter papayae]|nr:hypothetical protein [Acetobacter papayae]
MPQMPYSRIRTPERTLNTRLKNQARTATLSALPAATTSRPS